MSRSRFKFNVSGRECAFLVDTGATLSVINKHKVPNHIQLYKDNTLIKGIGGQIHTDSYAYITLTLPDGGKAHYKFYVLDNMPCEADGLIGLDFLRTYDANINLASNQLTLYNDNTGCSLQIHTNQNKFNLEIPMRSESMHMIWLNC